MRAASCPVPDKVLGIDPETVSVSEMLGFSRAHLSVPYMNLLERWCSSFSKKLGLIKSSGRMETELWAWEDLFSWGRLGVTWLNTC